MPLFVCWLVLGMPLLCDSADSSCRSSILHHSYWLAPVGASYSVAYALGAEVEAANDLD